MKNRIKRWTKADDKILQESYIIGNKKNIMNKLNRSWSAIMHRANRLGLNHRENSSNHANLGFFDSWSENMAYVLGFIYADGCLYSHNSVDTLIIELSSRDFDHLCKIKDVMAVSNKTRINNEKKSCVFTISSSYMCNKLRNLGICERKSYKEFKMPCIPGQYLNHFVRGYFDGDGCIIKKDRGWEIIFVGNKVFLSDMNIIINKYTDVGIKNLVQQRNIFRLGYSTHQATQVGKWMYKDSDLRLDRKYNKYNELFKYTNSRLALPWAKNEIIFLKKHYQTDGAKFCAEKLNKKIQSIYYKTMVLKLTQPNVKQ